MEKVLALLLKLGIELTADQKKQIEEVCGKEFVTADVYTAEKNKTDELTKQLETLKAENKTDELTKKLAELDEKYKTDTAALNDKIKAQEQDYAAEKLFSGYNFASDRVRNSVLAEFRNKGFKLENGEFVGGKEFLDGLKTTEPETFLQEKQGIFMGSTQSTAGAGENNLKTEIYSGFGFTE